MDLDFYLDSNARFNARCSALIYNKDRTKILIYRPDGENYYMLPGGRIEFNECSIDAVKREVKEETAFDLEFNLIAIKENFVKRNATTIMQYAFCYEAVYEKEIKEESFVSLDKDTETFYWVNVDELKKYNIVPESIISLVHMDHNKISHFIEISKKHKKR